MQIDLQEREDVLLRRSAKGDEDAFAVLYRRHQASIYRFALRMTGNPWAAEEIVQDVFMTVVRDPKKYDAKRGTLGAFLYGVARNRVMKHRERMPRETSLAVLELPVEFREAIVLCELEELSYEEAAKALDCPIGTIRSRLHRGRALLLAKLEILRDVPKRAGAGR
jgi:RNA polymerase sigma-70 factor (ECF subfamily)